MNPGVFFMLVTLMSVSSAQDAEKRLSVGNAQAAELEYEASFQTLQALVLELSDDDPVMVRARLSAGCVAVVLGKDEVARLHFSWVLKRNPDTTLNGPDADSPRVQSFYAELREEARKARAAKVSIEPEIPSSIGSQRTESEEGSVLWLGFAGASAVGGAVTFTSALMVGINDMVVGNPNQPAHVRRDAQENGRLWLGVGISSFVLAALGVGCAIWLAPGSE